MQTPFRLVACALALLLTWSAAAASESDPRPHILIIGESSSMPIRGVEGWYATVQERHPEWLVQVAANWDLLTGDGLEIPHENPKKKPKVYTGTTAWLPGALDGLPAQNLVLVMLGISEVRNSVRAKRSLDDSVAGLATLFAQLRAHPSTASATIALVTPLPVAEGRLDQWSKTDMAGAKASGDELSAAWVALAEGEQIPVIDARAWVLGLPKGPESVMTAGWMVRWDGIGRLGAWLTDAIGALEPKPADSAAFADWQRNFAAQRAIDAILDETGGGEPAIGPALAFTRGVPEAPAAEDGEKKKKKKKQKGIPPALVELDPAALRGNSLDLLIAADGPHIASFGSGSENWDRPILTLTKANGDTITVKHEASDWQYIAVDQPDSPVSDRRFGVSIGKWRPFPVVDGRPETRRHVLMRFRLAAAAGASISAATLTLPANQRAGYLNEEINGGAAAMANPGPTGEIRIHLLQAPDNSFHPTKATWNSKDGTRPWAGGSIDSAARRSALEAFLAEKQPAAALARAKALLEALP